MSNESRQDQAAQAVPAAWLADAAERGAGRLLSLFFTSSHAESARLLDGLEVLDSTLAEWEAACSQWSDTESMPLL